MRRFFQSTGPAADGTIVLADEEAHHAAHVNRIREGERTVVLDGKGGEYICEVLSVHRREVRLRVEQRIQHPRPAFRLRLVQAITKGKSFELILQKAVELGALEILPLLTERVVARPAPDDLVDKQARWQQVAVEAIKQCGAPWLPRVLPPMKLADAAAAERATELVLVAALSGLAEHPRLLLDAFRVQYGKLPESISVWIGPEGDFTTDELRFICAAGARPVTLGPRLLRSETAAIYALSILTYEFSAP